MTNQEFVLFAMLVAGKKSDVQADKLRAFLAEPLPAITVEGSAFEILSRLDQAGILEKACRHHGLGKYYIIVPGFRQLGDTDLNPSEASIEELEEIKGIGPKTSGFITQRLQKREVASLDTHILTFLGEQGYEVPERTPQSDEEYERLEQAFLVEADRRDMTPGELDEREWKRRTTSSVAADPLKT